MAGEKSITAHFLSNPEKYKCLIQVLAVYEDADFFSSARLQAVYKSVFARSPSTSQILQVRNFIDGRKQKIDHHINLCKTKPHSMILLDEHVSEIMNKLRLYDVVKNLKMERLNMKIDFLTEIMTRAWGSVGPSNGVALAKSYVRKQFEANKENKDLDLPDICKGYRIIQNTLVHFKNIKIKIFRDMCLVDKAKTMLKWLNFTEEFIVDVLCGRNSIDLDQIDKISSISESFQDDDIDIYILENFLRINAFEKLKFLVQSKKKVNKYTCGKCKRVLVNNAVQCNSCLIWYHCTCVKINLATISEVEKSDWFCANCL